MKIFLDTAELKKIKQWAATGLIDGVTTNPTHLSKEWGNPTELVKEICSVMKNGQVSVEVTEHSSVDVYNQAKKIAQISDNILVKIPCHPDYYSDIKKLIDEGIKLNITLVFSPIQAALMAKMGVQYVSPFIGRIDDIGYDGSNSLEEIRTIFDVYEFDTQIIAASIRSVKDFQQAIITGADVCTVPVDVFEKSMLHPLTDSGIKKFDADWQKLGIKQFPG